MGGVDSAVERVSRELIERQAGVVSWRSLFVNLLPAFLSLFLSQKIYSIYDKKERSLMSCINDIRHEIKKKLKGNAFTTYDFFSLGEHAAIRQALTRLTKEGYIRRVLQGVYDKPVYSSILKEFSEPSPHKVALALARKNNWQISLSGDAALNMLGLSTQIPTTWEYVSTGPYKKYIIGNSILEFRHRADTQMASNSSKTRIIIQAIKTLGVKSCSEEIITKIQRSLSSKEKKQLSQEAKTSPLWLHKVIQKICRG